MRQNIPVTQLAPGMKVVALDIGWDKSPKWTSPFTLSTGEDLALLLQHCKIVSIEGQSASDETSKPKAPPVKENIQNTATPKTKNSVQAKNSVQTKRSVPADSRPQAKAVLAPAKAASAPKVLSDAAQEKPAKSTSAASGKESGAVSELANHISKQFVIDSFHECLDVLRLNYNKIRFGGAIDADSLQGVSKKLLISTLARPGTLSLLSQLEEKDCSLERKSLDVAILCLDFGRNIGLPKTQLLKLCLSALLHDIGMLKVPQELLDYDGVFSVGQKIKIQKHVQYSCDILHQSQALRPLNSIVAYHHERFDGTGYPSGLSGRKIPLEARILSIVTTFEALTRNRHFSNKETPTQALRKIYGLRDQHYDGKLVERFIGSIGVYPVGTLVELNKQQIGMVTDVSQKVRSRPKVRCLYNQQGQPLAKQRDLDLAGFSAEKVKITRTVEPEEISAFSLRELAQDLGFGRVA